MWGQRIAWGAAALGIASPLVVSCSSVENTGVLGNGEFRYLCSSGDSDTACSGQSSFSDTGVALPNAIAVGATFQVGYAPKSSGGTVVQGANGYEIIPASPEIANASGDTIQALRSGYITLLARHVGNADVDDFVYLKFSPIQKVTTSQTSISMLAGDMHTIQLQAFDQLGQSLAGLLACQWQVTSATQAVTLQSTPTAGSATLKATNDGDATVTATCGNATVSVQVTVTGPVPMDGGTDAATDSATDGGTNG
jgi:hypothetical protein